MPRDQAIAPASARQFHEAALWAMVAAGFLALLGSGELDLPTMVLMPAALLLRAAIMGGYVQWTIPASVVTVLAALYVPFYAADYYALSEDFFGASVHMICFIAAVKLLTARTARDYFYLKLIAGMELFAAALLSGGMSFFVYLAIFLLCAMAAFTSGEILRSMERAPVAAAVSPRLVRSRLTAMSGALFLGIMLFTAALFFILPRTARAAFLRFGMEPTHLSFTSEVALGDIGELKRNSAPVMHARSYNGRSLEGLRWRGGTLATFDGKGWKNPRTDERDEKPLRLEHGLLMLPAQGERASPSLGYSVELSEQAPDTLFFAGTPETVTIQVPIPLRMSPSGSIRAPHVGTLRYGGYSNLVTYNDTPLSSEERARYLQLPPLDARITDLAQDWTSRMQSTDPLRQAQAIEARFQRDFRYTLEGLDAAVDDPLAQFLFDRKAGHCEYFASGMAVMLRTLGIPSRVATGFAGGVYNSLSGWQVLRVSDAHSWVEAWIPGRGWTTFDPTPPDPEAASSASLWMHTTLLFDAADQFWRDWIIDYNLERQQTLVARMQQARQVWQWNAWLSPAEWFSLDLAPYWWLVASALTSAVILTVRFGPAMWAWWRRRGRLARARSGAADASDATLLYLRMMRLLERSGWRRLPWQTPAEFAKSLPAPEVALLVGDLTAAYNELRFGGHADAAPRLAKLLERIETRLA